MNLFPPDCNCRSWISTLMEII